MIKNEWLTAGFLLTQGAQDWSLVKHACIVSAYGKQRPSALTNSKREYYDNIHADNMVKRSGFAFTAKIYNYLYSKSRAPEKIQNLVATLIQAMFNMYISRPSHFHSKPVFQLKRSTKKLGKNRHESRRQHKDVCWQTSVGDPRHLGTDLDPRIHSAD